MRHPGVPAELRGTYAGLGHEAAIGHLLDLGVTAVELLPVLESVPEAFLLQRGLTNYWGYNTIGYFAPHQRYSAAVRAGRPGRACRRVQGHGRRPAPGRARCRPQPHSGGKSARAHALLPRPGQRRPTTVWTPATRARTSTPPAAPLHAGDQLTVSPRSIAVLRSPQPAARRRARVIDPRRPRPAQMGMPAEGPGLRSP